MSTPRRLLSFSSKNETNKNNVVQSLAKRGRFLFGENTEEPVTASAANRPSVAVDPYNLRTVNKAYALRATRLPYSDAENVQVNFPANYESFAMAFTDEKMNEMNRVYPLYDSLEAFKSAPAPAIYVYGFFDTGFGALQVASYSEFLTRHTAVVRRMRATKVYAAGEIFKQEPTVLEYNVTSGTYSKELVDRHVVDTARLMEFVGAQFVAAGFTATPATPGTFITANTLPVTNSEINVFRRFGLNVKKIAKTRRQMRRAVKSRRVRRL